MDLEKTVWINNKVELLLRATFHYEASKLHNVVDWESCQLKFADILFLFVFWLFIPVSQDPTGGLQIAFNVFFLRSDPEHFVFLSTIVAACFRVKRRFLTDHL